MAGNPLFNVPGLAGYLGAQQMDQQQQLGQLQQMGALQGILAKVAEQQQQQAYRGALSSAKTPEEQAAVAAQFGGPRDVLQHADRVAGQKATQEATRARLLETARMNDSLISHRIAQEKDADERRRLTDEQIKMRNFFNQKNLELGGERLFYDTGRRIDTAAPPQPTQGQGTLQTTAPNMAAAMQQFSQGGGAPRTVTIDEPQAQQKPQRAILQPAPQGALSQVLSQAQATPNNLDARDLGAFSRGPVMGTATDLATGSFDSGGMPNYQSPAPARLTIADAPTGLTPANRQRWLLDQERQIQSANTKAASRESIAGSGVPSKETASFVARQYLNGNDQAISGYARSVPAKLVIMDAIRTEAEKQRLSPEAVNARIAEFQGTKAASRTIGTRSAGIAMAAEEAQQAIQIVKDTSANFQRTNFVPWNYALKAYDTNTGRPEIVEFGAAINALVNTYARALSPSGIPTVSDKEHARAILSTIQSPAQVDGVLGVINRELEIAKRAPKAVREQIRSDVTGENHGGGGWSIRPR